MNWTDAILAHLIAPVCGGIGGLALGMLLLSVADHIARRCRKGD